MKKGDGERFLGEAAALCVEKEDSDMALGLTDLEVSGVSTSSSGDREPSVG